MIKAERSVEEDCRVLRLSGDADLESLALLHEEIGAGIRAGTTRWIVDISGLSSITPPFLGTLLGTAGGLRKFGGDLKLVSPSKRIADYIHSVGAAPLFEIHPVVEAARGAFEGGDLPDMKMIEEELLVYRDRRPAKRVLRRDVRFRPGDKIWILDDDGRSASASIISVMDEVLTVTFPEYKGGGRLGEVDFSFRYHGGEFTYEVPRAVYVRPQREPDRIVITLPPALKRMIKRLHERSDVDMECDFRPCVPNSVGPIERAFLTNISVGGCVVNPRRRIPLGIFVGMRLLPSSKRSAPMELAGKAIRRRFDSVIIAFMMMNEEMMEELAGIIERERSPGI